MNPRGVTLVELLAAISIVVAVTALSLPAIQNRLGAARMEAAQGQIEAAVMAVRAEAVERGRSLELVARQGREGVEVVVRTVGDEAIARTEDGSERPVAQGFVWCVLPKGVVVTSRARGTGETEPGDATASELEVRIAIFLPDGTADGGGACYLADDEREFAVSVNSWVGGATFMPHVAEVEDDAADVDEAAPTGASG